MDELINIWRQFLHESHQKTNWWERKKASFGHRDAKIKQVHVQGKMRGNGRHPKEKANVYDLNITCHIEQGNYQYKEEIQTPYRFDMTDGKITNHVPLDRTEPEQAITVMKR